MLLLTIGKKILFMSLIRIIRLTPNHIDEMLSLQDIAHKNGDPFTPSSRALYERAFMYQNFVFGAIDGSTNKLVGYCNCSIPTDKAKKNLGIGILPDNQLNAVGHVNTILVDSLYRRNGYGGELLEQVILTFKNNSTIHYIFTTLYTSNKPSYNLFIKYGFKDYMRIENSGVIKCLLLLSI